MEITVLARKGDQSPHLEWRSALLLETEELYLCLSHPGTIFRHHTKGIQFTDSHFRLSLFPMNKWHNAMYYYDTSGQLIEIYCNVSRPPDCQGNRIEWDDLDLDVVERAMSVATELKERGEQQTEPFRWLTLQEALAQYGIQVDNVS